MDIRYFYTDEPIRHVYKAANPKAHVFFPVGHSKWTIRHFSEVGCFDSHAIWRKTPVTCLLRSPDGKHYISVHLPGFCPIHDLIPAKAKEPTP